MKYCIVLKYCMKYCIVYRLQDKAETRAAGPHHRGQAGGGGLALRLQHPRHQCHPLHDCLLHPGGGFLQVIQP